MVTLSVVIHHRLEFGLALQLHIFVNGLSSQRSYVHVLAHRCASGRDLTS